MFDKLLISISFYIRANINYGFITINLLNGKFYVFTAESRLDNKIKRIANQNP